MWVPDGSVEVEARVKWVLFESKGTGRDILGTCPLPLEIQGVVLRVRVRALSIPAEDGGVVSFGRVLLVLF